MLNKLTIIISLVLCSFSVVYTQTDTIYEYEEIIIYDTVVVYDTVKVRPEFEEMLLIDPLSVKILLFDTTSQNINLMIISKDNTATIPINGIILNDNLKNFKNMKKLNFIGLISLAFHTMAPAQSDYGITIETGKWWASCNILEVYGVTITNPNTSINLEAGFYYNRNFNNTFSVKTKLAYKFLNKNYSYKAAYFDYYKPEGPNYGMFWDAPYGTWGSIYDGEKDIIISTTLGEEASTINYHNIELPIMLGYQINRFTPYLGLKNSLKMFETKEYEVFTDGDGNVFGGGYSLAGINNFKYQIGLMAGVDFSITQKISLGVNYYHSFSKDFNYTGYLFDCESKDIVSKDNYNWKSRSIEISLSYSLKKDKGENNL